MNYDPGDNLPDYSWQERQAYLLDNCGGPSPDARMDRMRGVVRVIVWALAGFLLAVLFGGHILKALDQVFGRGFRIG